METITQLHPNEVLKSLLYEGKRYPHRQKKLNELHSYCSAYYELGHRNFDVHHVTARLIKEGVLEPVSTNQEIASFRTYRTLIAAWGAYHGPLVEQPTSLMPGTNLDAVLDSLLVTSKTPLERRLLRDIHGLCFAHMQSGFRNFSYLKIIGRARDSKLLSERQAPHKSIKTLIKAWENHVSNSALPILSEQENYPETVLRAELDKTHHKGRIRTLIALHDICREHHALGSLDFSIRTIGRVCEERGVMKKESLKSESFSGMRALCEAWSKFSRPWLIETPLPDGKLHTTIQYDLALNWVRRDYPQLDSWRVLAKDWLSSETEGLPHKVTTIKKFLLEFIVQKNLPLDPAVFLRRSTVLPDFFESVCSKLSGGTYYNNVARTFLNWVLARDFCFVADDGSPVVSPAMRNPIPQRKAPRNGHSESVYSPLPYGYIDELRQILASGRNFKDWIFAQNALGSGDGAGERGRPAPEWFDVPEGLVDVDDPDCVYRTKYVKRSDGYVWVTQMWSPVRWVALLTKLVLPLRTFQVRMLDSGEADTMRKFSHGWALNQSPLRLGTERSPHQQGVLRRCIQPSNDGKDLTLIYVNTNKTADAYKSGPRKGYEFPWLSTDTVHENIFYWFAKLRDWQEKYNPITRLTSWAELDARHMDVKSDVQLAAYPDTCFLFRLAEGNVSERHLPLTDASINTAWGKLLLELETRLASRGEATPNGMPIKLIDRETRDLSTLFPLHSLRVSLITALALEGGMPFSILQKLVGHSRLLMTLYYFKPGEASIRKVLSDAAAKMDAAKERGVFDFLLNSEYETLLDTAICNSSKVLASAIPEHPASRNAAGWMPMHHGLCLMGGNTSEVEGNNKIGGCHNGGRDVGTASKPEYQPVPGGSRNCVRCRWFVTMPHFLPALVAHFNNVAYYFDEARNKCMSDEPKIQDLKRRKAEVEESGALFTEGDKLLEVERIWESAIKRFSDLAEDLVACWRLIERCRKAIHGGIGDVTQLIAAGTADDVRVAFEETESELLQLSGVCEDVEVYPDLLPGKAVIRRSQLLDSALCNEKLPPVFMLMSESDQLLAGNAFLRILSKQLSPENPVLGRREIIRLIDARECLGERFGIDLSEILSTVASPQILGKRNDLLEVVQ